MPVWLRMNWLIGFSHLNWRVIKGKQLREMIWWRDTLKTWSAWVGSEKHNNVLPKKIFFFMTLLNVKGDLKCGASWSFWRVGIRGMQEFFFSAGWDEVGKFSHFWSRVRDNFPKSDNIALLHLKRKTKQEAIYLNSQGYFVVYYLYCLSASKQKYDASVPRLLLSPDCSRCLV